MKTEHVKDDHEALLDYLYEEGDPAERLRIAQHLQTCSACSVAVVELQAVRGTLGSWTPPASALGFKIVQEPVQSKRDSFSWNAVRSGWGQAAAAAMIFALGVAVSQQLDVEYGGGRVAVRARSASPDMQTADVILQPDSPMVAAAPAAAFSEPASISRADTARQGDEPTMADMRRLVRAEIEQSEARQQRQVALLLSQFAREYDTQRIADLRRVEQTLGQFEGQTGAEIQQQRQLLEMLVRTSGQGR